MTVWSYDGTKRGYRNLWDRAQIKEGNDEALARAFVAKVTSGEHEAQYKAAQQRTGVPWVWFASAHYRESSNDLRGVLHNGEKIVGTNQRTTLVPKGLGPFPTWADSADASVKLKQLDEVKEWTIERMLYEAERFNGLGYVGKNNSAYVWAGTTQEQLGMYVADHDYDPTVDDKRLGVAACLKALQATGRPDVLQVMFLDDDVPAKREVPVPPVVIDQDPVKQLPSVDTGGMSFNQILPMVFSVLAFIQQRRQEAGKPTDMMSTLNDIMRLAGGIVPDAVKDKAATFYTAADKAMVGAGSAGLGIVAGLQTAGISGTAVFGQEPTTTGLAGIVGTVLPIIIGLAGGGSGIGTLVNLVTGLFGKKKR